MEILLWSSLNLNLQKCYFYQVASSGAIAKTAYSESDSEPASFVARSLIYEQQVMLERDVRNLPKIVGSHLINWFSGVRASDKGGIRPNAYSVRFDDVPCRLLKRGIVQTLAYGTVKPLEAHKYTIRRKTHQRTPVA
jgi:hypothetical protein